MASLFWVGGTAAWDGTALLKWSATSGGVGGLAVPTAADDVLLDANSGASVITVSTTTGLGRSLDCTGFTGSLVHGSSISISIGNASGGALLFVAGMTYTPNGSGSAGLRFAATSTNGGVGWPITTAGKSMGVNGGSNQFTGVGGKWTFQDAWAQAAGSSLTLTGGELNTNGQTVSTGSFATSGTSVRVLTLGASTITLLTTAATTIWSITGSNLTINAASSTIIVGAASVSARTFAGAGFIYGTLSYVIANSSGQLSITGANTFSYLRFHDTTVARILAFTAATVTTILVHFDVFGTAGKLMTVQSVTAATHTINQSRGGIVSCDYLNLVNSIATGASFYAGAHSTDGGGNVGWVFNNDPNMMLTAA